MDSEVSASLGLDPRPTPPPAQGSQEHSLECPRPLPRYLGTPSQGRRTQPNEDMRWGRRGSEWFAAVGTVQKAPQHRHPWLLGPPSAPDAHPGDHATGSSRFYRTQVWGTGTEASSS